MAAKQDLQHGVTEGEADASVSVDAAGSVPIKAISCPTVTPSIAVDRGADVLGDHDVGRLTLTFADRPRGAFA